MVLEAAIEEKIPPSIRVMLDQSVLTRLSTVSGKINMNGKMAPHLYGAVYLILRKSDKILLMNRANTGWMDGHFSLPSGHMKPVRKDFP